MTTDAQFTAAYANEPGTNWQTQQKKPTQNISAIIAENAGNSTLLFSIVEQLFNKPLKHHSLVDLTVKRSPCFSIAQ